MLPNASLQLLPEAEAQRTLEAVSCKALFGGVCRGGPVTRKLAWLPLPLGFPGSLVAWESVLLLPFPVRQEGLRRRDQDPTKGM